MYIHKLPNAAGSKIAITATATTLYALIDTAASTTANLSGKLNAVDIAVEDGDIRVLFEGNTPTATNGVLLKAGSTTSFRGVPLTKMQLIRTGSANVAASVQVGQSEDSESTSASGGSSTGGAGGATGALTSISAEAEDPTSPATVTEGTQNSLTSDLSRRLITTAGTQIAGEDLSNDVLKVEHQYSYQAVVTADVQVKSGAGFLHTVTFMCNDAAPTAGSIIIYDSLTETGTIIFNHTFGVVAFSPFTVTLDVNCATGIYIGFTTTADVNVTCSYR